jgi:hypothetical protein
MPLGQNVEGKKLLRGIFDRETRRKAVAVADVAMELRARFGPVEPMEWFGSDRRDEEFRMVAVMDRVATTWSVLNGITMNRWR